ncbi:MAG: beta-lactamase family protein, partial [Candidatus Latescibacteria bacterium]|nr:beta-lactamase family protein [Candidatus Latescibacterota bacterium]
MTIPITDRPEDIGLSSERLAKAFAYIESWVATDLAPGAAIGLARQGRHLTPRGFGRMAPKPDAPMLPSDAIFLTASVTKPVACAAVMLLVERGQAGLDTPVVSVIPEFGAQGKDRVTIRHLLTHTSGLLDMIPENVDYRKRHAPLDEFIARICDLDLLFEPGTNISYQSAGIAILGEIVWRVTGTPLPEFLRREMFEPLGMDDTSLGVRPDLLARIPEIRLPDDLIEADWGWNKPYWRAFGAPWGGMFSTVRDMSVFC